MKTQNAIRRDIWSIKEWNSAVEPAQYVHTRMFYNEEKSRRWKRDNEDPLHSLKLVHPSQLVVELFVACGNTIER